MNDKTTALVESMDDMLQSAEAVKGAAFRGTVAGIFAQMQVIDSLGALSVAAAAAGANLEAQFKAVSDAAGAAAAHFTLHLTDADAAEAYALAERLMTRRNDLAAQLQKARSQ